MRAGTAAIAAATVLAIATCAASPATASPATGAAKTWTIRPGGTITATAGTTTLADTPTGADFLCASSSMSGTLRAGSGLPGGGIGSVATAAYSGCVTAGFGAKVSARGLPWRLNLTSYDPRTGVAGGTISHVEIEVVGTGFTCTAAVKATSGTAADGMVAVSYAGKTATLKILPGGGDLHWYHVRGCAGLVRNGDPATLSASYTISPRQAITSP